MSFIFKLNKPTVTVKIWIKLIFLFAEVRRKWLSMEFPTYHHQVTKSVWNSVGGVREKKFVATHLVAWSCYLPREGALETDGDDWGQVGDQGPRWSVLQDSSSVCLCSECGWMFMFQNQKDTNAPLNKPQWIFLLILNVLMNTRCCSQIMCWKWVGERKFVSSLWFFFFF